MESALRSNTKKNILAKQKTSLSKNKFETYSANSETESSDANRLMMFNTNYAYRLKVHSIFNKAK